MYCLEPDSKNRTLRIFAQSDLWLQHAKSAEDHIWALLDHLAPSAQSIVAMIYDRLAAHGHLAATEKGKTIAATSFLYVFPF